MSRQSPRRSAADIRRELGFPVVDTDGHCIEFFPAYADYLLRSGKPDMLPRLQEQLAVMGPDWATSSWEERRARRMRRGLWWAYPAKVTEDRAAASLPRLMYERLDEIGFDMLVVYPSIGLALPMIAEEDLRLASVRAMNEFLTDQYGEFRDRIRPTAVIPMHTPDEALAELEYAVGELGMTAMMMPPGVPRPIPALHRTAPEAFPDACWVDHYGLDSEHDYDPVWARCRELGVAPTFHGGMVCHIPWVDRSITSTVCNHTGNMAYQQQSVCKSLFLGGVTRRFPELNFAFLEGGASWACILYSSLIEHWKKRGPAGLVWSNPANLDRERYRELFEKYGGPAVEGRLAHIFDSIDERAVPPESLNDFGALDIEGPDDIRELFVPRFYFGCEADDPTTAWALDTRTNPLGATLNAIVGSDLGHYDVPEFTGVLGEVVELVEKGSVTLSQLEDVVCRNAIRLHGQVNPKFFEDTPVEDYAAGVLGTR